MSLGGLVVRMLAFYSINPSSTPAEGCKMMFETDVKRGQGG